MPKHTNVVTIMAAGGCLKAVALGAVLALGGGGPAAAADAPAANTPDAFQQNRQLGRGVNVLGYDPIWQDRRKARFQQRYFRLIKEAGFSSVRINLRPFRDGRLGAEDSERAADGTRRVPATLNGIAPAWFETLDWAIRHARAAGLMVVLDLHEYEAMGDDPAGNRERLLAVWRQIARHCQDERDDVLFEVLNEPCNKLTPELWNPLLREALGIIRASNPRRTVIVGPGSWNSIDALPKLELPEADRRLIVTVHYYNPFAFTHQGTSWTMMKDKTGVAWNGTEAERQAVAKDLGRADAWARRHGRPVFLGEFGTFEKGDMASRARWASCVARQAEKLGWSWAWWQFEGNFAVYDTRHEAWVGPIRQALLH